MIGREWLSTVAIVLAAGASAQASFVNQINPSTGIPSNAQLTSFDFTDHIGNDPGPNTNEGYVGPGSANGNFTDLSFNVLQQGNPFNVQVVRAGGNAQAAEYWFEVTLNNQTGATINDFGISLLSAANGDSPALAARFDLPDGFNSSGGTFTRVSDSFGLFTGLGLLNGASTTLGFSLDFLADTIGPRFDHNSPLFLQFTATPEPHAVLLGGLCLMAFVGVLLQRRRQANLVQVSSEPGSF